MIDGWKIHTVVLDLDDTLYPERDYVLSGFAAVDRWLHEVQGVHGFGECATQLFEAGRRGTIFDQALACLGCTATPELIGALVKIYRAHTPVLRLSTDAEEILPWLAERFQLAALTDGYAGVQRRKFTALGLSRWIHYCVVTDEIGREFWKPHPAGFERIMTHFSGAASGFVYVADNPRKDFLAPKQLGWRTVRMKRKCGEHAGYPASHEEEAEVSLSDLRDLRALLAVKEVPT